MGDLRKTFQSIFVTVLVSVISGCNIIQQKELNKDETIFPSSTNLVEHETNSESDFSNQTVPIIPNITIENGRYTDNRYNFTFDYDDSKFVSGKEYVEKNKYASIPADFIYVGSSLEEFIFLTVTVNPPWGGAEYSTNSTKLYFDIYEAESGEIVQYRNALFTNIESKEIGSIKQSIFQHRTQKGAEIEHSVTYSSVWILEDGTTITLDLIADPETSEDFLYSNKYLFDQMIESFEFY